MNSRLFTSLFLAYLFHATPLPAQTAYTHHDISVTLSPEGHRLSVKDSVTLPADQPRGIQFTLHKAPSPASPTPGVHIEKRGGQEAAFPRACAPSLLRTREASTMQSSRPAASRRGASARRRAPSPRRACTSPAAPAGILISARPSSLSNST